MLPQQVITEQFVDASIKHGVGVADFAVVAMVLHQTVRLQRVRTDLAAEADGILARVLGLTGGIALAVSHDLGLPILRVGVGESIEDLRPFDAHEFARALITGEEE